MLSTYMKLVTIMDIKKQNLKSVVLYYTHTFIDYITI